MSAFVVDTNVLNVANRDAPQAGVECVINSVQALAIVRSEGVLVLDSGSLILDEYRRNTKLSGTWRPGDAFFKWAWDNQWVLDLCERVPLTPVGESFAEFPDATDLVSFHPDDRKFVAVARASTKNPELLNAVDSDYWEHKEALENHGVRIHFLCPRQFEP